MFDVILQNQELAVNLMAALIVLLISLIFKRQVEKSKLVNVLFLILDICQDVANKNPEYSDDEKKKSSVAKIEQYLAPTKKKLVTKIFGSIGGAAEFVWKNRKTLISATSVLLKKVF